MIKNQKDKKTLNDFTKSDLKHYEGLKNLKVKRHSIKLHTKRKPGDSRRNSKILEEAPNDNLPEEKKENNIENKET